MKKGKKCEKCAAFAPVFLRIMVGLLFLVPGLLKLQALVSTGTHGVVGMLWGVTAFAWILALVEVIAGGMIVAGYKQCVAAMPLVVILIVALIMRTMGGFDPMTTLWHLVGIAALIQVHVASPCGAKKK